MIYCGATRLLTLCRVRPQSSRNEGMRGVYGLVISELISDLSEPKKRKVKYDFKLVANGYL